MCVKYGGCLALGLCCTAGVICAADQSANPSRVVPNGDFEKVDASPKAFNKTVLEHMRTGWDFSRGPIAFIPEGWYAASGIGHAWSVDLREEPDKKEFVHSGNASFMLGGYEGKSANYMTTYPVKMGNYELSIWTKGPGKLILAAYVYDNANHHLTSQGIRRASDGQPVVCGPSEDWVETRCKVELGTFLPRATKAHLALHAIGDVYIDDMELK